MRRFLIVCLVVAPGFLTAQVRYLDIMDHAPKAFPIEIIHCDAVQGAPPVVDGDTGDKAWEQAQRITGLRITDNAGFGEPAKRQTELRFLHDSRTLYISFVCLEPDMGKVRAENRRFDFSDILYDDRIEVLFDPGHDHANLVRLAVNSLGVTYDTHLERPIQYALSYLRGDDNYNIEWRAKVKRYSDRWTGEIAIALDRFIAKGTPLRGVTWGINVARDSRSEFRGDYGDNQRFEKISEGRELSAIAPVRSKVMGKVSDRWIEPIMYADMLFDQRVLDITQLNFNEAYANYNGSIWQKPQFFGDNPLTVKVKNLTTARMEVTSLVETTDIDGKTLKDSAVHAIAPGEAEISSLIRIRGSNRQPFRLTLKDKEGVLYQSSYTTRVPPIAEFNLAGVYLPDSDSESDRNIYVAPITVPGATKGATLKLELLDSRGRKIASDSFDSPAECKFVQCFKELNTRSLADGDYTIACRLTDRSGRVVGTFDQLFTRHRNTPGGKLRAENEPYSFGGVSGNSVTVHFPAGMRFVFWEEASYVPWWDLDNMAVTYEFMESWGYGNQGCNEPMQDKEPRYSKPEIIESSPARAVVLWRYALSDANYRIFFGEWVNEYYYLYPDGSGVRQVCLWANNNFPTEVMQPQYIMPSGVVPQQMFRDTVATLSNLRGEYETSTMDKPILSDPASTGKWSEEIMRIYINDRPHPWLVWSKDNGLFDRPINNALIKGDAVRSAGGHWPMRKLNVDVYSITSTDIPYHTWLGAVQAYPDPDKTPNAWVHLIGLTDSPQTPDSHIRQIADNWLHPPVPKVSGATFVKFDAVQKAYVMGRPAGRCSVNFDLPAGKSVVNPVFIFAGEAPRGITVKVGGKSLNAGEFEFAGIDRDYNPATLLWVGRSVGAKDTVTVEFK